MNLRLQTLHSLRALCLAALPLGVISLAACGPIEIVIEVPEPDHDHDGDGHGDGDHDCPDEPEPPPPPPPEPRTCYSDVECGEGAFCDFSQGCFGDCPEGDGACLAVCLGICVDEADPPPQPEPPAGGACLFDDECPSHQTCDTESYCDTPPYCDGTAPCPDVCYGRCVDVEQPEPQPEPAGCESDAECAEGERCESQAVCLMWCEEGDPTCCEEVGVCVPDEEACFGAWLDHNGLCRAPNDGVYPDACCAARPL